MDGEGGTASPLSYESPPTLVVPAGELVQRPLLPPCGLSWQHKHPWPPAQLSRSLGPPVLAGPSAIKVPGFRDLKKKSLK